MSETSVDSDQLSDESEASTLATLRELNAETTRAFVESDIAWYADHLSDDFVMAAGNGRRLDKTEFLRRMAEEPGVLCGLAAD